MQFIPVKSKPKFQQTLLIFSVLNLLKIFCENSDTFYFDDYLMNRKFKRTAFFYRFLFQQWKSLCCPRWSIECIVAEDVNLLFFRTAPKLMNGSVHKITLWDTSQ